MRVGIFLTTIIASFILSGENSDPMLHLLVNQAGYDRDGPKRIWLQADFDPAAINIFFILRKDKIVDWGNWGPVEKVIPWNLWYRVAEFSSLENSGEYQLCLDWQGETIKSLPFKIETCRLSKWTGPLTVKFFSIQRCGTEVQGWHAACHLDDARLPDGSHRDLAGGWHDAGDYNKYNGYTPLSVYALAKFAQSVSLRPKLISPLQEALWGGAWLRKCQDSQTKKVIGRVFSGFKYWGIPENETDNISGNGDDRPAHPLEWNDNELTVTAYAALCKNTGDFVWKKAALELWEVVRQHDPADNILQWARRLLAAIELYKITEQKQFLEDAKSCANYLVQSQRDNGSWPILTLVDFGLPAASLAEFILEFSRSPLKPLVHRALLQYLNFWENSSASPFTVPKWSENSYFYPYSPGSWYVGQNSMYLSQAWAGFLLARLIPEKRTEIRRLSYGCLDWVLGANPLGICMMSEAGSVHLKRYHHRYDSIPNGKNGNVPGAVANGITRKMPDSDVPYLDLEGNSWQTNEPWLPHNAYFLLALSALEEGR